MFDLPRPQSEAVANHDHASLPCQFRPPGLISVFGLTDGTARHGQGSNFRHNDTLESGKSRVQVRPPSTDGHRTRSWHLSIGHLLSHATRPSIPHTLGRSWWSLDLSPPRQFPSSLATYQCKLVPAKKIRSPHANNDRSHAPIGKVGALFLSKIYIQPHLASTLCHQNAQKAPLSSPQSLPILKTINHITPTTPALERILGPFSCIRQLRSEKI